MSIFWFFVSLVVCAILWIGNGLDRIEAEAQYNKRNGYIGKKEKEIMKQAEELAASPFYEIGDKVELEPLRDCLGCNEIQECFWGYFFEREVKIPRFTGTVVAKSSKASDFLDYVDFPEWCQKESENINTYTLLKLNEVDEYVVMHTAVPSQHILFRDEKADKLLHDTIWYANTNRRRDDCVVKRVRGCEKKTYVDFFYERKRKVYELVCTGENISTQLYYARIKRNFTRHSDHCGLISPAWGV